MHIAIISIVITNNINYLCNLKGQCHEIFVRITVFKFCEVFPKKFDYKVRQSQNSNIGSLITFSHDCSFIASERPHKFIVNVHLVIVVSA